MHTRDLPTSLFRTAMFLVAVSCVVAVTPLPSQQAPDSTRVAGESAAQASAPTTTLPGPRLRPPLPSVEAELDARINPLRASPPAAQGGGRHTIVISTLALVLGIIIIVLLVK